MAAQGGSELERGEIDIAGVPRSYWLARAPRLRVEVGGGDLAGHPRKVAEAECRRAVADLFFNPFDPDAHYRLGASLLELGRPEQAYPHLTAAAGKPGADAGPPGCLPASGSPMRNTLRGHYHHRHTFVVQCHTCLRSGSSGTTKPPPTSAPVRLASQETPISTPTGPLRRSTTLSGSWMNPIPSRGISTVSGPLATRRPRRW